MQADRQRAEIQRVAPQLVADSRVRSRGHHAFAVWVPLTPGEVRDALPFALSQTGFPQHTIDANEDFAFATIREPGPQGPLNVSSKKRLHLAWAPHPTDGLQTYLEWVVIDDTRPPAFVDDHLSADFGQNLWTRAVFVAGRRITRVTEIVLGPGEVIDERLARAAIDLPPGAFRDYSGFAKLEEVPEVMHGQLRLGTSVVFGLAGQRFGPPVFLGGGEIERRGLFIHGLAGSGRTRSAVSLIRCANNAGYHVLALDSSGDVARRMDEGMHGTVLAADADRVGYLPQSRSIADAVERTVDRLANAMLDRADLRQTESPLHAQSHDWLSSIIALQYVSASQDPSAPLISLADTYAIVTNESRLVDEVNGLLRSDLADTRLKDRVSLWIDRLMPLISPERMDRGRRDTTLPYGYFAQAMARALQPFNQQPGAFFESLTGADQSALVIRLPIHDQPLLNTCCALIQRRLVDVFSARTNHDGHRQLLVVIDDVDQLGALNVSEVLTLAPRAGATMVITGKSIELPHQNPLPNCVGMQLYLAPIAEDVRAALNAQLGARSRQIVTAEFRRPAGRTATVAWQQNTEYLGVQECSRLPFGRRPAILFGAALPIRKPLLLDVDSLSNTLTVSSDGTAEYRSLAAAIDSAPPHACILLRPGTYREAIVLTKPVEILAVGPAEAVVLEGVDSGLSARQCSAFVRNVTLSASSTYALRLTGATLALTGCRVRGSISSTLGKNSLTLRKCEVQGRIEVSGSARLEDSRISSDRDEAVRIQEGACHMYRCDVSGGRQAAVRVRTSTLVMEDCTLSNAPYGVIATGAKPHLRRCRIERVSVGAALMMPGGDIVLEQSRAEGAIHQIRE